MQRKPCDMVGFYKRTRYAMCVWVKILWIQRLAGDFSSDSDAIEQDCLFLDMQDKVANQAGLPVEQFHACTLQTFLKPSTSRVLRTFPSCRWRPAS